MNDVVHEEKKLTLVFEYLDEDLKKYIDENGGQIPLETAKVFTIIYSIYIYWVWQVPGIYILTYWL